MKSYEMTAAAALAAISAALQLVHLGWASPWGIWIDLVAVSWIVAYFIYGPRTALVVSVVSALIITVTAPSTWLGAFMKWTATVPFLFVMLAMQKTMKVKHKDIRKPVFIITALSAALIIRSLLMIPLNYYFAIPIWMPEWTLAETLQYVPWWAIAGINTIQGVLEAVLAWMLVFRFRLDRFSEWQ